MLTRQGNPSEFLSLSKTMDIDVVEIISLGPDGLLDGFEDDDVSHILN